MLVWSLAGPPDLWEYETLATNLLEGHGFVYQQHRVSHYAFAEPLYPFLAAGVYAVTFHSFLALAIVQVVASSLLAVVVFALGTRLFSERSGLAAGFILALHPGFVRYSVKFHPLVFDALLMALVALAWLRVQERPDVSAAAIVGLALGLSLLSRPLVAVFALIGIVWWFAVMAAPSAIKASVISLALAAVVLTPWLVRNYAVLGVPLLGRSHVGYLMWLGNNPEASGTLWTDSGVAMARRLPASFRTELYTRDELGQSRLFAKAALRYIREEPWRFLARLVRKLYYFWWFGPSAGRGYAQTIFIAYKAYYAILLGASILGAYLGWRGWGVRGRAPLILIILFLGAVAAFQSFFYVEGRHRLMIEWALVAFAGHAVHFLQTTLLPRLSTFERKTP